MYVTEFRVKGRGSFPLDMLRYDACYPASSEDVAFIDSEERELRTVHLKTVHTHKLHSGITEARWLSFGWSVSIVESRKV